MITSLSDNRLCLRLKYIGKGKLEAKAKAKAKEICFKRLTTVEMLSAQAYLSHLRRYLNVSHFWDYRHVAPMGLIKLFCTLASLILILTSLTFSRSHVLTMSRMTEATSSALGFEK